MAQNGQHYEFVAPAWQAQNTHFFDLNIPKRGDVSY